jgi:hypothetical protein
MDYKQKEAPTDDLNDEQKETYIYLMNEARTKHPKTSNYILDLAIRFYIIHGDNILNVKSLSEDNLKKMKDQYASDCTEFYGNIEIIRDADISQEQREKYEIDKAVVIDNINSSNYTDELMEQFKKVAIIEGISQ